MRLCVLVWLLLLAFGPLPGTAATWLVLPDGSGDWPTIQMAIDSSSWGDTIVLGCGVFHEHGIVLRSGLTVVGETGSPECVVVDGDGMDHVFVCSHVDEVAMKGLTITGGFAYGATWPEYVGGGMWVMNSSPQIEQCVFRLNEAETMGGGIYLGLSSATVVDCVFEENTIGASGEGGGIYVTNGSSPLVERCRFIGCEAYRGGALCCLGVQAETFVSCDFVGNRATQGGGAVHSGSQAAPTFESCTFHSNWAYARGGAIYCLNGGGATLTNCTLSDNESQYGAGGIECWAYGWATLENTILAFSTRGASVYEDGSGVFTFSCTDVYGNAGGDWVDGIASQAGDQRELLGRSPLLRPGGGRLHAGRRLPLPGRPGVRPRGGVGRGVRRLHGDRGDDLGGDQEGVQIVGSKIARVEGAGSPKGIGSPAPSFSWGTKPGPLSQDDDLSRRRAAFRLHPDQVNA
ncbi:MAG: right-handed parallel beta-helix repeat-containing protein [Candidatus Eisenbacteria bacterium]